jgi:hypothetical protein
MLSRSLSYADAAKLLGGTDNKAVKTIDMLMSGMLLATSAAGSGLALGLFEAKDQLVRLSKELIAGITVKASGIGRIERTDRIAAAHAVIVLTAYFEALSETEDDLAKPRRSKAGLRTRSDWLAGVEDEKDDEVSADVSDLIAKMRKQRPIKSQQVKLVTGHELESSRARELAYELLHTELPVPTPQVPYEESLRRIEGLYLNLTRQLPPLLIGPDLWAPLNDNVRRSLIKALINQVPTRAITRYESLFLALASEFPEVPYWSNRIDQQATRAKVGQVQTALSGIQDILTAIACGRVPDDRREALARFYQSALERQIAETGEVPSDTVTIPTLGSAYIDPNFRATDVSPRDRPDVESWWDERDLRTDIDSFLTGFLTSPDASSTILMVLGQPGSGKSVLTKVLSARLPASQFLAMRVVLREVPADADVQTQIEYAIRDATGESITWPDLARSAPDTLPVILLDGFDELLQATGVSQSDYLDKVARFQEREAIQGRRIAFLVTSRTAVVDRARIPAGGVACIRLEPFSPDQVELWVSQWNRTNSAYFTEQTLKPLATGAVLAQPDLAEQPLLLLMLALYDADSNALQRASKNLSHAQLYERLLSQFAEREVRKERPDLDGETLKREVDLQLLRLSIAAFAMFNRGRQWSTQSELDDDLTVLLPQNGNRSAPDSFRAPLTPAQLVVGQFFFVHQAQAIQEGSQLSAFEFLHATFGEYLVARIVASELRSLAAIEALVIERSRHSPPDDSYLRALLSFAPLSSRATTVDYLSELIRQVDEERKVTLGNLLKELFRITFAKPSPTSLYSAYEPADLDVLQRVATYSANLLLLIIVVAGEVTASALFPGSEDAVNAWRRAAMLWRAALPEQGWLWLVTSLDLRRIVSLEQRDILASLSNHERAPAVQPVDLFWTYDAMTLHEDEWAVLYGSEDWRWQSEAFLVTDVNDDVMAHALEPLLPKLSASVTTIVDIGGQGISAAHALIRLWVASTMEASRDELTAAYEDCIDIALHAFEAFDHDRSIYRGIILHLLSVDRNRLPGSWRDSMRQKLAAEYYNQSETGRTFCERVIVKLGFKLM